MSQENVEVARRLVEALNQRDEDAREALWHPDGEIDWSRSRGPFKGVYRGQVERQMFFDEFRSTFGENTIEIHGFVDAGAEVVVPNTGHHRGRGGIEVTARSTFVFTVENGLITRMRLFQEHAEALEAVGLPEQDAHADS